MKTWLTVILLGLCLALTSNVALAGKKKGKPGHSYEKSDRDEKGRGDKKRRDDDDDDDDDECERDDDDHHCGCPPTVPIPTPTPSTPPATTASGFLTVLNVVPSTTTLSSTMGSVARFYTPAQWSNIVGARTALGNVTARVAAGVSTQTNILGVKGIFQMNSYATTFANGVAMIETVAMEQGTDGVWRVAYYSVEASATAEEIDEAM